MKRFSALLLTIAVMFIAGQTLSFADSPRMGLCEAFTNTSCGYCPTPYHNWLDVMSENKDVIIPVTMHFYYPSTGDPIYAHNIPMSQARLEQYYGVTGVPNSVLNGSYRAHTSTVNGQIPSVANQLRGMTSPHDITLNFTPGGSTGTVDINVATSAGLTGQEKLRVYVVEKEIHYDAAPGSNGEKDFYYVSRKMLPDADGTQLSIAAGNNQDFHFTFDYSSEWDSELIYIVAFIQNDENKEVLQAETSEAKPLRVSMEATSQFNKIPAASSTTSNIVVTNPTEVGFKVRLSIADNSYIPDGWTYSVAPTVATQVDANGGTLPLTVSVNPNGIPGYAEVIVKAEPIVGQESSNTTYTMFYLSDNVKYAYMFGYTDTYLPSFESFAQNTEVNSAMAIVPISTQGLSAFPLSDFDIIVLEEDYSHRGRLYTGATAEALFTSVNAMLDAGGNVINSGELSLYGAFNYDGVSTQAKSFFNDYLGISQATAPTMRVTLNSQNQIASVDEFSLRGVYGDPIGSEFNTTCNKPTQEYQHYVIYSDNILVNSMSPSTACLYFDNDAEKTAAVRATTDEGGKIFFMSTAMHALSTATDRNTLMDNIITWMLSEGPDPEPTISCAANLNFEDTEINKYTEQELTISNTGEGTLNVTAIQIMGDGSDAYSLTDFNASTGLSVEPGSSEIVTVRFSPTEEKQYSAAIFISSNDKETPQAQVIASGTGTPGIGVDDADAIGNILDITVGPNPVVSQSVVSYTLNSDSPRTVEMSLVDASGRTVRSLMNSTVNPGTSSTIDLNASSLSSGTYFLVAKAGSYSTQKQVVITK